MNEPSWEPTSDGTPSPSRVRLVPLEALLDRASDRQELEWWTLKQASQGQCRIYWQVPWDRCAFSGPFDEDIPVDRGLTAWPTRDETLPACWKARPEVKFVRIGGKFMESLAKNCYAYPLSFPDGLYVPGDVTHDSGVLAPTTYKVRIRISLHTTPAPRTDSSGSDVAPAYLVGTAEVPEVDRRALWVEEGLVAELDPYFQGSPLPSIVLTVAKEADPICSVEPASTASASVSPTKSRNFVGEADPYRLSERAPALYALYTTSRLCASAPDYKSAATSAKRRKVAKETLSQQLTEIEASGARTPQTRNIRRLFGKTRIASAIRLIDIHYDHNCGREKRNWIEWPTLQGKAILDEHDDRRKTFVTDILRLMIAGADFWHELSLSPPLHGSTKQQALQLWLEEHGFIGTDELKTAFAIITWNGQAPQIPPKFASR